MDAIELRRLVGDGLIHRAINEEALAVEIVAKAPGRLMGVVQQMQRCGDEREKKRLFEGLTRDEQLAFTFLASDPKAAEKVRDHLHRNA